ncbi:helix-turn-helix domain-containing protein [Vibrio vulnificus]|uniref:helix-turn-helix domain-containing protein n=1 Tax=Vibrio vulnificus TaxID=672 RepID=UPI003C12FB58
MNNPLEFKWLEDFLSLMELGNFSAAAKARFVTQSAFSRRIQAWEVWVACAVMGAQCRWGGQVGM